jgi:hypothetical protein
MACETNNQDHPDFATIYLMAQRKAWHHALDDSWEEVAWERFSYIECGVYRKPWIDLDGDDRQWVRDYGSIPDGWITPTTMARYAEMAARLPASGKE